MGGFKSNQGVQRVVVCLCGGNAATWFSQSLTGCALPDLQSAPELQTTRRRREGREAAAIETLALCSQTPTSGTNSSVFVPLSRPEPH